MDILAALKELNAIEDMLDRWGDTKGVPTWLWYERRNKIVKQLKEAGYSISLLPEEETGMKYQAYAVYCTERRDGSPEKWEERED